MNQKYYEYLKTLSNENATRMEELVEILKEAIPNIEFSIAKYYPTFYIDSSHYIMITFFKNYCNILAVASFKYRDELKSKYFMHPKGMIKLMNSDNIDKELFIKLFQDSIEINQSC